MRKIIVTLTVVLVIAAAGVLLLGDSTYAAKPVRSAELTNSLDGCNLTSGTFTWSNWGGWGVQFVIYDVTNEQEVYKEVVKFERRLTSGSVSMQAPVELKQGPFYHFSAGLLRKNGKGVCAGRICAYDTEPPIICSE